MLSSPRRARAPRGGMYQQSEKKMKLNLKGGAALDANSGLEHSAHVPEKDVKVFSIILGLVDFVKGTNSCFKEQLLEDTNRNRMNNANSVQAKVEILDDLLDIEVACSLLRARYDESKKDLIDVNYEKFKTSLKVIDKDSEEVKINRMYVKNTHAMTPNAYNLEAINI
ncbi:Poly [ADP-ribose] polymerase 1 [Fukomys damarensis]|uniref:NAD(+) ADP-ribosyltransferase n=1 Tax=Fukomys damarensis TaxID=885580 RepID=A0A091DKQ3_FUKDA|nr:Poly [ADP-ribose] polymerase 1 [Fukomys damarensis]